MLSATAQRAKLTKIAYSTLTPGIKLQFSVDMNSQMKLMRRLSMVYAAVASCFSKEGIVPDHVWATDEARKELGLKPIRDRTFIDIFEESLRDTFDPYRIPFPSLEMKIEFRAALALVGKQPKVGAWPLLWHDLLAAYDQEKTLFIESYPQAIDLHPQTILGTHLSDDDLVRFNQFFHAANVSLRARISILEAEAESSVSEVKAYLVPIITVLIAIAGYISQLDEAGDFLVKIAKDELEKQEKDRQKREFQEALDKSMREAPNAHESERWLHEREMIEKAERTA